MNLSAPYSTQANTPDVTTTSDSPDYLAGALLHSLMRPVGAPYLPRLSGTTLLAVLSMGVIPLVALPSKLRGFASVERDQFWHFSRWMHSQFGETDDLDPRTPSLDHASYVLRLISWACAMVAFGAIAWFMLQGADIVDLSRAGYQYFRQRQWYASPASETFFNIWMPALCIGYAAQWAAVQVHQIRARQFVEKFNAIAATHSLQPLATSPEVIGLRSVWIIGAAIAMYHGVLWGVPLMLAGGAQTRYITSRSRVTRAELAQRVRDVLRITRPQMRLALPVSLKRRCPTTLCQATLASNAIFCSRCGTRIAVIDRVA